MQSKRVFKLKTFARWARKILTDDQLCAAAQEVLAGLYEAELGGGVCKKRIALAGQGKSGSTRALIAKNSPHGLFFMAGRSKNDPGSDFSAAALSQVQIIAPDLHAASLVQLEGAIQDGYLEEICHDA